jgi:folate-dependent phosphoribosylglycinamide formyltransferase PurN
MNTFKRVLRDKEKFSGCSVHYVSNKLDAGKIILQKKFFVSKNETVETLKLKTQRKEYRAFSEAITKIYMTS